MLGRFIATAYRRLYCASLYYSGNLQKRYHSLIKNGAPKWRIIRYEHIINPEDYPLPLSALSIVRPKTFESHLRYFLRNARVLPLDELVDLVLTNKHIPENALAITIDGGWRDTYQNAFPLLARYQMPATVFLPTSVIGTTDLIWTDRLLLSIILLRQRQIPATSIKMPNSFLQQTITSLLDKTVDSSVSLSLLFEAIWKMDLNERVLTLNALASEINAQEGYPLLTLHMNWDEVRQLKSSSLIKLGTLTHNYFSPGDSERIQIINDINESLATFSREQCKIIPFAAYPHGTVTLEMLASFMSLHFKAAMHHSGVSRSPTSSAFPVFGRVPIFEDVASSRDLLAVRLWGMPPDAHVV